MALAEEILTVIAKNQFTEDPYEAEMLQGCLSAVMQYYHKKDDRLLDGTLEIVNSNVSQNALINVLSPDKLTEDIIDRLEPKELLQAKIWLVGWGKNECNENEKQRLRKLYIKVLDTMDKKMYN